SLSGCSTPATRARSAPAPWRPSSGLLEISTADRRANWSAHAPVDLEGSPLPLRRSSALARWSWFSPFAGTFPVSQTVERSSFIVAPSPTSGRGNDKLRNTGSIPNETGDPEGLADDHRLNGKMSYWPLSSHPHRFPAPENSFRLLLRIQMANSVPEVARD